MATKIISYNVNGLRSALSKDWLVWLKAANPDVLCLQEIKCFPESIDQQPLYDLGYKTYWNPAKKPGYSGVALFCKKEPDHVEYGCGIKKYDEEGNRRPKKQSEIRSKKRMHNFLFSNSFILLITASSALCVGCS